MDSLRLESLKNKDEHAQTAKSSQEVREHLAGFIRSKQGSSTQISTIANQQQQQQQNGGPPGPSAAANKNNQTQQQASTRAQQAAAATSSSQGNKKDNDDDHPLRKTASMPTMHVPYKAQSLSRRRQMERRTTMSPLMVAKRKSRPPKRPLLHSLTDEYSSNPCILHASEQSARSLSQSSSPPAPGGSGLGIALSGVGPHQQQQQQPVADQPQAGCSQTHPKHQHQHLYQRQPFQAQSQQGDPFKLMMKSSSQTHLDNQSLLGGGGGGAGAASGQTMLALINSGVDYQEARRMTNHARVQEVLRRTVLSRATSKGKISSVGGTGGSLDSETVNLPAEATCSTGGSAGGAAAAAAAGGQHHLMSLLNHSASTATATARPMNRDELRQWSLDAADLRTSGGSSWSAANRLDRSLAWGLFHRELHRLRLATTSDAATLRRSQSPNSSISMGVSGTAGAPGGTPSGMAAAGAAGASSSSSATVAAHRSQQLRTKLFASSSSSTSSLVSGHESFSLDDSSSQAIDLTSRRDQRQQQQQSPKTSTTTSGPFQAHPTPTSNNNHNSQQAIQPTQAQAADNQHHSNGFNYQKMLQESFNQLQLCQSREAIKQMLLPAGPQSAANLNATLEPPSASSGNISDFQQAIRGSGQDEFFASLARQFNLSASAQNLISAQQQHQEEHQKHWDQMNHLLARQHQHQQDLNHWLLAYNQLLQSQEFQQSTEITSSLLTKMSCLPEPHRSALLAQMIIRQNQLKQLSNCNQQEAAQQQQQQQANLLLYSSAGAFDSADQKSLMGRTLSSPMLVGPNNLEQIHQQQHHHHHHHHTNNLEMPMQAIEFEASGQAACGVDVQMANSSTELCKPMAVQFTLGDQNSTSSPLHSAAAAVGASQTRNILMTSLDLSLSGSKPKLLEEHHALLGTQAGSSQPGEGRIASTGLVAQGLGGQRFNPASLQDGESDPTKVNCYFMYNPLFNQNSSTGIVYELELCNHKCICQDETNHPENSFRVLAIWRRLHDRGLMAKCARVPSRRATISELQLCHGETYANYFGRSPYERIRLRHLDLSKLPIEGLTQLECGGQGADIDTAWNEEQTPGVARLAAGCVIEAAVQVATGKLQNAFAIVRPPGHHAEHQQAMGFCFFNSVAVAARVLLTRHSLSRVLIVDWDVHHGNGIQKMFYEDKSVMYISLHRHDKGNFFPGSGSPKDMGAPNQAEGFNLNIAWSDEIMGDAEYLAAFRSLVMPVARDFDPSIVLVASGFDGARGHPFNFGGYELSPACFASMTTQLSSLAGGRLVLCLEGGYQLKSICDCAEACVRALLNASHQSQRNGHSPVPMAEQLSESELSRQPNAVARETLHQLSQQAAKFWPSVARWRETIDMSALEAAAK